MKNKLVKTTLIGLLLIFPPPPFSSADEVGTSFSKDTSNETIKQHGSNPQDIIEELQEVKSKHVPLSTVNEKEEEKKGILGFLKKIKNGLVPLALTILITSVVAFMVMIYKRALELKRYIESEIQKTDEQIHNLDYEIQALKEKPLPQVFEIPDDVSDRISKLQEDIDRLSALEEQLERDFLDDSETNQFYI